MLLCLFIPFSIILSAVVTFTERNRATLRCHWQKCFFGLLFGMVASRLILGAKQMANLTNWDHTVERCCFDTNELGSHCWALLFRHVAFWPQTVRNCPPPKKSAQRTNWNDLFQSAGSLNPSGWRVNLTRSASRVASYSSSTQDGNLYTPAHNPSLIAWLSHGELVSAFRRGIWNKSILVTTSTDIPPCSYVKKRKCAMTTRTLTTHLEIHTTPWNINFHHTLRILYVLTQRSPSNSRWPRLYAGYSSALARIMLGQ